jgi:signal transduction histidine kinase
MRRSVRQTIENVGLLLASLAVAMVVSLTPLATQIDRDAYDWIFRIYRPPDWPTQSIVLGIDEETFHTSGGVGGLRAVLAEGLELIAPVSPKAVAIDVILADAQRDDARLEQAIRKTPNVILASYYLRGQGNAWEEPLPRFSRVAAGVGHAYAEPDPVCREILPEKAAGYDRRWALALETYLIGQGQKPSDETQASVRIGDIVIRPDQPLLIRYRPPDRAIRTISLAELRADHSLAKQFSGKTVFFGVTAQTAEDRQQTPYSTMMPGVEIHANVFETIANRLFLVPAPSWAILAFCVLLAGVVGAAFALLSGWQAYATGVVVLLLAPLAAYFCFTHNTVLPFTPSVFSVLSSIAVAAFYQSTVVRRRMLTAEGDKSRYQQAIHFVTHEMRTPLTAIQGSSELIGRYALTEEKRKQMAQLINSESKRLGRMIEIFLSVERVSAGQIELKKEQFSCMELMRACVERVRPLAERKQIRIQLDQVIDASLGGDRELMEYAFYNLLTNAVKYSPPSTEVTVFAERDGERLRLSVKDQGIGMDRKEVRKIFQKFYRTKKAEESGEVGTGIGLSIVEQIVTQHGGSIEVSSSPGRGSCFTLLLPTQKVNTMVESK